MVNLERMKSEMGTFEHLGVAPIDDKIREIRLGFLCSVGEEKFFYVG